MTLQLFSNGGGVQSTAILVLCATGKLDIKTHIFSDVGRQAENPDTVEYVQTVLKPYAQRNDIAWIEVCKRDKDSKPVDLYTHTMTSERSIPIPVRFSGSGAPGNRSCTQYWKIEPVSKYIKSLIPLKVHKQASAMARGQSKEDMFKLKEAAYIRSYPVVLNLGISTDEAHRARTSSGFAHYRVAYPLLDLDLNRADCLNIIKDAGLPVPPKSSCWFCPYHKLGTWQDQRRLQPALFLKACRMEQVLSDRSVFLGKGKVFFTSRGVRKNAPLSEVTSDQLGLFDNEAIDLDFCESGHCGV